MIQHEQCRRAVLKVVRGVNGSGRRFSRGLIAVLALLLAAAGSAGASVRLIVQPQVMVADGRSTLTVSAEVRDQQGRMARDGTAVRFMTTAGQITPVVYTSAGVARATLTSSTAPTAAMVTAFAGADQASVRVQMVSDAVEANVDGRVLRISGRYVAFSEALHYLDAVQDIRVRYRGLTIEADGLQIDCDSNELRAFGRVGIASGDKVLQGDRLYLNLTTFDGYVTSVERKVWFSGFGLNELPEEPRGLQASFEFKDLTRSTLTWVGKEAVYIPGTKVQVQGARAYVGGIKALRMPYHEARLDGGIVGDYGQYIGAGSRGLVVDIPLYVAMTPNATTAVRFRNGDRAGFGYFNTRPGFGLDLEEKYGVSGQSEGMATLNDLTTPNWGFRWNHSQQLSSRTRVDALLETPAHRDFFSHLNLAQQFEQGNATLNLGASQLRDHDFGRTLDAGFETTAEPLLNQQLFLSFGTRYTDIAGGQYERFFNHRFDIKPTRVGELNMRLRPAVWQPLPGVSLNNNLTLRSLWGTTTGPALAYYWGVSYSLPGNGMFTVSYTFDQRPTIQTIINQAHHNLSATASITPVPALRATVYGNMGVDSLSRSLAGELSYKITPSWRFSLLNSFYQFTELAHTDYQLGIARKLGPRELVLFYSTRREQILFEIAASQF